MQIINVESAAAKITVSYQLVALCTHLGSEINIIYEYLVVCSSWEARFSQRVAGDVCLVLFWCVVLCLFLSSTLREVRGSVLKHEPKLNECFEY